MPRSRQVILYVVPNCPLCSQARRWLQARSVEYLERDVAGDWGALRSMYELTRQRLVPVIEQDGRAIVRPTEAQLYQFLESGDEHHKEPETSQGQP